MGPGELSFAVVSGITISGLISSMLELATGRPVTFAEPLGDFPRALLVLMSIVIAGPFMLMNDASAARREGVISETYLFFCGGTALAWVWSLGIVAVHVATLCLPTLP